MAPKRNNAKPQSNQPSAKKSNASKHNGVTNPYSNPRSNSNGEETIESGPGQENTNDGRNDDNMDVDDPTTPTSTATSSGSNKNNANATDTTMLRVRKGGEWQVVQKKFKKVKHNSANRREQSKTKSRDRDGTPDRGNRDSFRFKTRVTVKMNVPNNPDSPYDSVLNATQDFLQHLDNSDPGSALLPWKANDWHLGKIDKTSTFPTEWDRLKPYFHSKFWVPKRSSQTIDIYPNFYLGHNKSFRELKDGLGEWLSSKRSIYRNILQVEDPSVIGFLLYSTRDMDAGALADEISFAVGFNVGLKWKVIDNGRRNLPKEQQIRALIVEVASCNRYQFQRELIKFYSSTTKGTHYYPNGVRLRFVKAYQDALNTSQQTKIEKLRKRQKDFLNTIRSTTSYSLYDIDMQYVNQLPTLRQMIMSIRINGTDSPLFHSVDLDYQGRGHTFQYSNDVAAEAECAINTLLPYLTYLFPSIEHHANRFFDQEAISRCEGLQFDPARGMVIEAGDSGGFEIDLGEHLGGFAFRSEETAEGGNTTSRPDRKTTGPQDDDSISTFGGSIVTSATGAKKAGTSTIISPPRTTTIQASTSNNQHGDDVSVMSAGTTFTMNTIKTLREDTNEKFKELKEDQTQIANALQTLMKGLGILQDKLDEKFKPEELEELQELHQQHQDETANSPEPSNSNAGSATAAASGKGL